MFKPYYNQFMYIDSKLSGFRSYLSENRLNNGGVKTSIDQSAVAPSEQNNVEMDMQLDEHGNPKNLSKKKKKQNKNANEKSSEEKIPEKKSDSDLKKHNLKLLNLL